MKPWRLPRALLGFGVLAVLLSAGAGCFWNKPVHRRFYTLTQSSSPRTAETRFDKDVWVREVEMASVYDRPQIVFRHSPTELRYFNLDSWADRPQRMLGQHLVQVLRRAGLFRSVSDRLSSAPPDYTLEATVTALEQLDGGDLWYAHLAMTFRLSRFGESAVLWEYSFDERRPLMEADVSLTVRALSEILDEEMDTALAQIEARLAGRPLPPRPRHRSKLDALAATGDGAQAGDADLTDPAAVLAAAQGGTDAGRGPESSRTIAAGPTTVQRPSLLGDRSEGAWTWGGPDVDWRRSAQYASDPTIMPAGKGAIFLPALSGDPEREPTVEVHQDGESVASGLMGRRIPVAPGRYKVHFGSGTLSQRMVRQVDVSEGEVAIVEPDWSALDISVLDEKFIPWRGSYEINDRIRTEYVGLGYGADEEQGERTQVWVLRPGVYKVVQPGANYRARTNFATVQLPPGDFVPFVLVMDPATNDFLGAGVSDMDDEGLVSDDERWTLRSSLGGDVLWNNRSGYDTEVGSELAVTLFSDNLARFKMEPHLWTTRLEIEESHRLLARVNADGTRESLADAMFEPVTDRVYANSLYIYELLGWAGPYARVGWETSLFNRYRYPGAEQEVLIFGEDGTLEETIAPGTRESVRLAHSFSPLEFKQGVGVNFRVWHTTAMDLDLRVGLGGRQYLALGQLLANDERSSELNALVLERASNSFLVGPETTIVASWRFTRYLQATTEFDALVPFGGMDSTRFTWRNAVSLRLSNFASLIYTLNLDRNPNVGREDPLAADQGLRLRFSFVLF